MRTHSRLSFGFSLALLGVHVGCDEGGPVDLPPERDVVATAGTSFGLTGEGACAIDSDCSDGFTCFQGQCAADDEVPASARSGGQGGNLGTVPGLSIVGLPDQLQPVSEGQASISVTLELSAAPPPDGLAYRVEREDDPEAMGRVRLAPADGRTVTISVPTGRADPARGVESGSVYVNLVTAAGTVNLLLAPAYPEAGTYAGEAVVSTFGQLPLPFRFSVVTDPENVPLEDATAAYLVLPVEPGNLFNPTEPAAGGPEFITRPLEFDDFVQSWVARFDNPFELTGEASAFGWVGSDDNAVTRRIRIELTKSGNGQLVGRISDRWSGLFEVRSEAGIIVPEDILFEGDFEARRIARAPDLLEVTPPLELPTEPAGRLPPPVLDQCDGVSFAATATVAGRLRSCGAIDGAAAFAAATPAEQTECALAMSQAALAAGTTADQIVDFLDDETPNPGGQSFAEFMEDCVTQTNGTCVPAPEMLCSRQLVARAVKTSPEGAPELIELVTRYQDGTREAFLGRQFGAFYADAQTRLDWLQAQNFPAIVTAAVQSFVADLLEDWQANVLEAHVGVLRGQFDASGGAVLGQDLTGAPEALNAQRQLLLETSQSWRSAAEAFALGADRWGTLLTDARDREAKALYVYDRALDLYVMAGLLAELNRQAGAGANNAVFAGGFRPLLNATRLLAQPFDRLIYERQGEVVISTSLDPNRGNEAILEDLRESAMQSVDRADTSVTEVIAQAQAELLQQAELTARFANEAGALEAEIAEICGLPEGCTEPDGDACAPRVSTGQCGFVVDSDGNILDAYPDEANISEAGAAVLEVQARILNVDRARAAVRAHINKLAIDHETTEGFARRVTSWNQQRQAFILEARAGIADLRASSDAAVRALAESLEEQYEIRNDSIAGTLEAIEEWETVRIDGINSEFDFLVGAAVSRGVATALEREAEAQADTGEALAEALPTSAGTSVDATAPARSAILLAAFTASRVLNGISVIAEQTADQIEIASGRAAAIREAELTRLEQESDVGSAEVEAEVERVRNEAQLVTTASQLEQGIIREVIINLQRELEATLAYERDVQALEDRRAALLRQLAETEELLIQASQARLGVTQAMVQYSRSVQRAQLLSGRLAMVRNQLQNINQIIGSPAAVFAWANRLNQAESRLERAKDAVMEWVVALEYFAVRPFFDARIQILLARNTTQLELIAAELERLQDACGGAVNTQVVEVSIRGDLLGITEPIDDLRTGQPLSPQERFRTLLEEARVPIDKRVRYRSDATVGDLLNRGGILAATFDVDIDDFANLGVSCNAKVQGVSIQIVGQDLGSALPTVSLLYDGTSRLRSCQPNINQLVDLVGRDLTPFGEVTELEVVGRGVAPVAGINEFPGNFNVSLGGLPFVSQYTVLIDPQAGENSRIDWSRLDDIRLRVEYGYQDLFPAGQCQ